MALRLTAAATVSPPPGRYEPDPAVLDYHRDLCAPFGLEVDEAALRSGPNIGHTALVDALAGRLPAGGGPPDLVLVSYALPDLDPYRTVASRLNHLTGGKAQSLAVSDQGLGGPFSALRFLAGHARTARVGRALLAVLEQTTLPVADPALAGADLRDTGILLAFEASPGTGEGEAVRVTAIDDPGQVRPALVAALAGARRPLLVAGPWFDPPPVAADHHRVPPGSYGTGVWWALAENWRDWGRDHDTVVLCDRDPRSGAVHLAVLRASALAPATPNP